MKEIIRIIKKILKYIFSKIKKNKKKTIFFLIIFLCIRACNNYIEETHNCDDRVIPKDRFELIKKSYEEFMSYMVDFKKEIGRYPNDREDFAKYFKNHKVIVEDYNYYWSIYQKINDNTYIYKYNHVGGYCIPDASKRVIVYIYNPKKGWFHTVNAEAGGKHALRNGGHTVVTILGKTAADNIKVEISKYIRDYVDKGIDPFKDNKL